MDNNRKLTNVENDLDQLSTAYMEHEGNRDAQNQIADIMYDKLNERQNIISELKKEKGL